MSPLLELGMNASKWVSDARFRQPCGTLRTCCANTPSPFLSCTAPFGAWCCIGFPTPSIIGRWTVRDSRSLRSFTNGKTQTCSVSEVTSNEGLLQPGSNWALFSLARRGHK